MDENITRQPIENAPYILSSAPVLPLNPAPRPALPMPSSRLSFITAAASQSAAAGSDTDLSQVERDMLAALMAPKSLLQTSHQPHHALHRVLKPHHRSAEPLEPVEGFDPRD